MKKNSDNLRLKANAGFSLIDILVGMVIALLGIIIIFQVFSVSEGVRRTTTSGGDAVQNGAAALFSVENTLKNAGAGIFPSANAPSASVITNTDSAGTAPVTITAGGAASVSDTLLLKYRGDATYGWDYGSFSPSPVFGTIVPPALTFETISVKVNTVMGHQQAQLVSTTAPDPTPGVFAGNGTAYATLAPPAPTTNNVIAENIVLMKVEYGIDNRTVPGVTGNKICNPTANNPPTVANLWAQTLAAGAPGNNPMCVAAVRIALVARSAQPEKPSVLGGACDATTVFPTSTLVTAPVLDLSGNVGLAAGDDWKCYRYKTFENTVPLRNVIWR